MSNSDLDTRLLSSQELDALSSTSINLWTELHGIRTETGNRLDFRNHLFLYDIYADWSPLLCCYKAAQIGFTTMAINKSLWAVKNIGLDAIYTMPTGSDINDFVSGKVNRIIEQNPVLQGWVQDRDTIDQKKVGDHVIYYRGTFTERAAISVSSDLNIHDEEDRSNQEIIAMYASRQQHSKFRWEWHFSNPSVEGNGVSRYWPRSDQKHWFITCVGCGEKQFMSWPDSVDRERRVFQCKKCHKALTDEERRVGEWVRKWKDRDYSGYWISLLMAPWITAGQVIDLYETKPIDFFYNFVLGLPYVGEGNTVSMETLFKNCSDTVNDQERAVIGSDSGIVKHYVIGNRQGLFFYGKENGWDWLRKLLKEHPNWIAVLDAMPDITEPRRLVEEFPGRVFLCHYVRDRKTMQLMRWGRDQEEGFVTADRNRLLQVVIDEFAAGAIPISGRRDEWVDYGRHWKTLYRITEIDALGMPVFEWKTSDGNDHWCHATAYWRIGMDRFGWGAGAVLAPPDVGPPALRQSPAVSPDFTVPAPRVDQLNGRTFTAPKPEDNDWRI